MFNSGNSAGNWRELTFAGGSYLAFYLIQNDTSANWLVQNASNTVDQQSLAFFSLQGANPDGFDHSQSTHLGNGIWRINWEDLTGGGDQDFNDVVFNVGQPGILLPGQEEQTVPLTIDLVSNEAIYQNEMGYFLVDTPDGKIADLLPGDKGYADAVLEGDRHQVVMTAGETVPTQTVNLPSGKYLGWYLVANGTTTDIIQSRQNNTETAPHIFFSYSAANQDGLSHLHAQADSHTWAWEDIFGGGDRDFDDLVFRFNLGEPIGLPTTLPSLSIGNVTLTEGDQDTQDANFTVRLSEASTQAVTVEFATEDDTAKAGEDYQAQTGMITFAAGELEKTISVKVSGDRLQESTESFKVNLTNANNALISQGVGIGTILDNDEIIDPTTNNPPVVDADKTITLDENSQPINLGINTPTDIDGDNLIVTVEQLPDASKGVVTLGNGTIINVGDEVSINSLTSLLFAPIADTNGNGGSFVYVVSYGKGGSDRQRITFNIIPKNLILSVAQLNSAPEFVSDPELEIFLGQNYTYDANATDVDGDSLFYSLLIAPDGLTIDNNTGVINWDSPILGNHTISLLVEDGKGGQDKQDYNLSINEALSNRPPVIISTAIIYGNVNTEYRYQVLATDADNDSLTYSVINPPQGLSINENTGIVTWTPTQLGETEITLQVNDNKGGVATQIYKLLVQEQLTDNYAPVIISEAIVKASTNQNYVYDVNAIDPDADNLIYSLVTAPQGMTINELTGEIIWDTASKTVGNYDVTVRVIDNRGGVDTQESVIALNNNLLGTITGFKWEDINGNGFRDTSLVQGDNPDVVFVLDVSGSADDPFVGTSVGDVNNDGLENTRLDAEIAGFIALNQQLITQGLGTRANVAVIVFSGFSANADMDLVANDLQLTTTPTADINNNSVVDVEEILKSITSGAFGVGNFTGTNIEAALQKVEETFLAIGTETSNGNLIFLTDGESNRGGSINDEIDRLKAKEFNLSAFGVGENASLAEIQLIDPDGFNFTSTDQLLGVFGGLEGEETFIEPGLAGVTVYLDLNNNGILDINEPTQITVSDDPSTPNIDETGQYQFTGLEAGTYIVREIVTTDYQQTYPLLEIVSDSASIEVLGTNNPWLSGMPDGSTASQGDVAPEQSAISISELPIIAGSTLTFGVTGSVNNDPFSSNLTPDGSAFVSHRTLAENGLSNLIAPINSLVGVFLGDEQPNLTPAPDELSFEETGNVTNGINYTTLSPELKQIFFIGDGKNDDDVTQEIIVPEGATYLFLGTMDGHGWYNNYGSFDVTVTANIPTDEGYHIVKLEAGETVNNINFGNQKIDQPIANQAPIFTSTAPTTAQINQLLTYQATATDANSDRLTYSLLTKPQGMTVDRETGILIWQPKQNQIGNNRVVLQVSDGKGGITTQEFTIATKGINTPPQIISSLDTQAILNTPYTYQVRATDSDNDNLTYSLINPAQGMSINANTGLIEYTPSQLGTQTIEIQVTDGFGGSNTQSYQLRVLENLANGLPSITSTPQILISSGGLYQYDVNAIDPENTAITYGLTVKTNGMTIDANTGLITWQTQNSTNGDFQVTVSATDADGGIAYQNYFIRVAPNQAPIITSTPLTLAQTGLSYKYDVIAGDADGNILSYSLTQAPDGLTIDQAGRIRWQPKTQDVGIYPVIVQVSDGRGGIVTQNYNLSITNDDITNPVVQLGFNTNLINIGETINFQIQATDNVEVKSLTLTANGTVLNLNPNSPNGQVNTATFVGQQAGVYQIIGTATDAAGNVDTEAIEVRVIDPSDTEAPLIEIDKTNLQATQGIISKPTNIIATVTDDNLEFYRVEIAPVDAINLDNLGENDPDYILLTEGNSNIANQTVATLDPRLLANGSYFVRITAFDFSGNGNIQGVILNVTGQNKPGDFSLEYTDLSIPLTGIPIEITRRYNSLESSSQGDFGYGWDLGLQDANIVEASPDGRDLSKDNFFGGNSFTVGTRVTLNTPDGRRVGFTFNPVVSRPGLLGAVYAPSFTPDAGVFDKLEAENTPLSIRSDGSVGLYLFGFTYNPSQYKLTTKDGTVYNYDQNFGLIDVKDRNGNTLTFSEDGIVSSTGAEIDFVRDAQGRITEIIDPDGKSIKYAYDSDGDLIEVIDRTNNTTELVYDDPNRQHFLTEIIDPLGRSATRTEYDENGQISKIIDANGNELEINFDAAASSQTIKDSFGNTITRVFDAQGNVIQEVDQLGGITLRTYDEDNNLLSETDPEGNITSYTYDNRGNKLTETDGEGNKKTFTYNEDNDILTETTALGFVTTYTYDDNGNLTQREDAEGNVTEYEYNNLGLLTAVTDANDKISTFKYDGFGNLTELTDPTGAKTTFTYDSNGQVASVTDAFGAITNYIYDAQGRLIEKADPEGSSCGCARGITKTEYNAAGEKIAEIDALGRRTEYRYNDRGLLIATILPDATPDDLSDNPRTQNEYDALDRLTGFTDELGRKTIYVYDALGREIEVIYPDSTPSNLTDNPRTKKEYDKAGRVIAEIDELGNRTEFDYDQADRLVTVTNALNQAISYTFDTDGRQIAMTDALGRITEYDYDDLDRLLTTTYANDAVMTTTYDPLGRVIAETDLAGNTTNYEYDALGRLTAVIDALNQRTEYKYDSVGNLIEQKDANGNITKFEYDSLRRLQATILPDGQRNETIHDKIGNLGELATVNDNRGVTSYVYDERNRLVSRTEPDNRTISYTYDKASNILTLTVPSGTTTYTYDALNRIDTVKDADNGVTDYDYDAVGNLVKTIFPNGVIENQEYDLLNRLTYLENRNSNGVISSYTYTLDAMGNRVKVVENDGRTVEYDYANLYRLTEEKITDAVAGNKTVTYTFDAVGNRLQRIDSVEGTTTYTYDDNDRLLQEALGGNVTQYQYDEEGNLTAKVENGTTTTNYEWNAKGELTAVEVTENGEVGRIEFEYDHNGIRVAINVDGEETRFLIDNNQQQYAQVIEEYQTNGTVNTSYTHGWDLISQDDGTNRLYYQVDGLGSTRLMTDNNGAIMVEYDYDAYGNLTRKVGDAENNYLFAGEQFDDAVDGYYLRARYYDFNTGRLISRDPFVGFEDDPESQHKYNYGENDPINQIDPTGLVSLVEYRTTLIPVLQKGLTDCLLNLGLNIATDLAAGAVAQGVYVFLEGDKWYVGKSVNLNRRAREHASRIYKQSFYPFIVKGADSSNLRKIEQYLYDIADSLYPKQTANKIRPLSPKRPSLPCPV